MQDLYQNMIVDITDPECAFIREFDHEVLKYGAVVYNHESNSYQFIRHFEDIDIKKELLPDFIKVEATDELLKGMKISVHYEFDPEQEEDEENLSIWKNEISRIELPHYEYDEEGEVYLDKTMPMNCAVSYHTVWFLTQASYDTILDTDLLLLTPIIKEMDLVRKLIKNYGIHPFKFVFDPKDEDYQIPELPVYHHHDHEHEHDDDHDED